MISEMSSPSNYKQRSTSRADERHNTRYLSRQFDHAFHFLAFFQNIGRLRGSQYTFYMELVEIPDNMFTEDDKQWFAKFMSNSSTYRIYSMHDLLIHQLGGGM